LILFDRHAPVMTERQLQMNSTTRPIGWIAVQAATTIRLIVGIHLAAPLALCAPVTNIAIDGSFADWADVPSYVDAAGGGFHAGTSIADVHGTGPWDPITGSPPAAIAHPDVDLLEYKFTHDENNLYAYFRAAGIIGKTQHRPTGTTLRSGRYYVIVTIDVDDDDSTGYWLHEGGYAPTSRGYDMNMELEFFDGSFNTGHYLSHDALTGDEFAQDFLNLTSGQWDPSGMNDGPYTPGFVQPAPGNYDNYTQWVYHENDTLTLVSDGGPVVPGIMSMAVSPDGHEIEICAPFRGFLTNAAGNANMALGKTLDISFSLEASGELAPGNNWGSDTGDPIIGYYLEGPVPEPSSLGMIVSSMLAGGLIGRLRAHCRLAGGGRGLLQLR
jgi:hypothetical protein